ncbi:MAG: M20/M25/M40 family metallo-hydrolase [Gemmatimonadaceae bacterium]
MNRASVAALGFTSLALSAGLALPGLLAAQQSLPAKFPARPTAPAITPADLMTRVYSFADDSMMGRQTGTVYHDKGTDYIARELARLGLTPAGENGTYFQPLPIVERNLASGSSIAVDGRTYSAWRDFLPRDNGGNAEPIQNATAIYGGMFRVNDTTGMINPVQAAGKVVVFTVPRGYQADRPGLLRRYPEAAAIVIASLDAMPKDVQNALAQPEPQRAGLPQQLPPVAFFYTTGAMTEAMFGAPMSSLRMGTTGQNVRGSITFVESQAPGVRNVIALLPGTDPALRGQYVALGAHSDHEGFGDPVDHDSLYAFYHVVRPQGADDGNKPATAEDLPKIRGLLDSLRKLRPARVDSIFNGADDDASGSMGLLEVAEAFATAREKPKRSILFVWHAAEEQGMLGSGYFVGRPTVPRDSIVAQINLDMIGRGKAADTPGGGPGYLQLIGARRLSTELGDIVEAEGKKFSPAFRFDYQFDANGHAGQFYCRSDHWSYARFGIPVVFMSTGGHPEYHQVTDEPQYLDYDQLTRVSQLVLNTANRIANLDHRLVVDKPKPDPRANCVQ